jgi:hypothetical protein
VSQLRLPLDVNIDDLIDVDASVAHDRLRNAAVLVTCRFSGRRST